MLIFKLLLMCFVLNKEIDETQGKNVFTDFTPMEVMKH